jgi:regulator of protease activity HflC (stomatin/prohibitin superfamily)
MLGFSFVKLPPTTYAVQYKNGKVVREGLGLSFFYFAPFTSLVAVPMGSTETQFIFEEVTADYQQLTVQGQIIYQVKDPLVLARALDYGLKPDGVTYRSSDPQKLSQRIVAAVQVLTKGEIQRRKLQEALQSADALGSSIREALPQAAEIKALGVEILSVSVLAIKPTPETARALEADMREKLMQQADEAIFIRRNAAVEQERAIKENELQTEVAVELKKRQIRETEMATQRALQEQQSQLEREQMESSITLEDRNKALVALQAENERAQADAKAYGSAAMMKVFAEMNPAILQALATGGMTSHQLIGHAFQQLAQNAEKIGELNMSPELLRELLKK